MFEERAAGAPTPRIDVGAYVKVGARAGVGGERFWCVVTDVRAGGELSARVDNDLVLSAYRCGDTIALHERHVLETASVRDCLVFRSLVTAHGLANGAAVWASMRHEEGASVEEERNTLQVVPLP